jgi:aspartate carbamoyltransferase catalytic subunit
VKIIKEIIPMKHFLDIETLTPIQIAHLLERAQYFKNGGTGKGFMQHSVAQLFYENSTRTRVSFEMAAKNLGMRVVNIDLTHSSELKGEAFEDTIYNLYAMGIRYFIIRHPEKYALHTLAKNLEEKDIHFINAGDGSDAHPSQAMLDIMTILAHKPDLSSLKIALVGNIRHSRVANSLQQLLKVVGCGELVMVAPKVWQPQKPIYGRVTESLVDGLTQADVVITLRVQKERIAKGEWFDLEAYRDQYALTQEHMRLAKPDAIVMHPGPVNRDFEIDSAVVDSQASKILEQVSHGVFMRMAILESLSLNNTA